MFVIFLSAHSLSGSRSLACALSLCKVTAIYAIFGTHYFRDESPKYFLNFKTSMFSMFQVVTGDSWASGVSIHVQEYLRLVTHSLRIRGMLLTRMLPSGESEGKLGVTV